MKTNNAKHTPGPWNVRTGWIEGNDRKICADFPAIYRDNGESEANARLIAAAPDLLKILHNIRTEAYGNKQWSYVIDQATIGITKAEGL